MMEWAKHFINWITTAGLLASCGFIARLSYRLTRAEKDIDFLEKEQLKLADDTRKQTDLLLDIRDRLTRLEVVLKIKQNDDED